jgi:hypothetical protein
MTDRRHNCLFFSYRIFFLKDFLAPTVFIYRIIQMKNRLFFRLKKKSFYSLWLWKGNNMKYDYIVWFPVLFKNRSIEKQFCFYLKRTNYLLNISIKNKKDTYSRCCRISTISWVLFDISNRWHKHFDYFSL